MSSTPSLLICQALILLPDSAMRQGDLRIQQGQIAQIAPEITPTDSDIVIDATGLTLLPGVIDPQVHFRELGLEHQEDLFTATRAFARRGVTSFLEMPNTRPLTTTQATLDDKLRRAAQKSLVNYGFFIRWGNRFYCDGSRSPYSGRKSSTLSPQSFSNAWSRNFFAVDADSSQAGQMYTIAQVANWMSAAVAKAYGIPNKGAIAPGYDADLVQEMHRQLQRTRIETLSFFWSLR